MRNAVALAAILMRLVGNSDLKKPVERKLHDGDLHQYRLSLREHTFVRLQLIRQAVEVRVIVWGPKGEKLREGTSLNEAIGALPVLFVAEQSGEYRVGVQANGLGAHRVAIESSSTSFDPREPRTAIDFHLVK